MLNIVISKIFLKDNHESDNSIEDKNQLMLKNSLNLLLIVFGDFLFKHKIKRNKGGLVDALEIRGDEGSERLR